MLWRRNRLYPDGRSAVIMPMFQDSIFRVQCYGMVFGANCASVTLKSAPDLRSLN